MTFFFWLIAILLAPVALFLIWLTVMMTWELCGASIGGLLTFFFWLGWAIAFCTWIGWIPAILCGTGLFGLVLISGRA